MFLFTHEPDHQHQHKNIIDVEKNETVTGQMFKRKIMLPKCLSGFIHKFADGRENVRQFNFFFFF